MRGERWIECYSFDASASEVVASFVGAIDRFQRGLVGWLPVPVDTAVVMRAFT